MNIETKKGIIKEYMLRQKFILVLITIHKINGKNRIRLRTVNKVKPKVWFKSS